MDNASNNATMLQELARLLEERDIVFDPIDRKVMCYAHVIDLCTGRVIDALTKKRTGDDDDDDSSGLPLPTTHNEQTYDEAVARDPIALGRAVVRAIRASGTRRDAFDELIETGNKKGYFTAGQPAQTVEVKKLQLLRDVRTRWDSVYYMLNRLRELRPVRHDVTLKFS
jgi:hypothetical protein